MGKEEERTADVISEAPSFRDLLLPKEILSALERAGYQSPSPVQHAAIPLARLGSDVIVQAKAGTGKTLVFAVTAVERVNVRKPRPQVLLLAPTREVALQAADVVTEVIGSDSGRVADHRVARTPIRVTTLIGGVPTAEDERVLRRVSHIVVGSPGRVLSLVQRGSLITSDINLLVLDEADRLLDEDFYGDVSRIIATLPKTRQILALSATYTKSALDRLNTVMSHPQQVFLCQETVSLKGVWHYVLNIMTIMPHESDGSVDTSSNKIHDDFCSAHYCNRDLFDAVCDLLQCISFHQALIFCNSKSTADEVTAKLSNCGHSVSCLSSAQDQLHRIEVLNALRAFQLRIVVATDVAARGIDLEGVNLVINMDIPGDPEMLVHRIGRAGRFGTHGTAVTLVNSKEEESSVQQALRNAGGQEALVLPAHLVPGTTWSAKKVFPGFDGMQKPRRSESTKVVSMETSPKEQVHLSEEMINKIRLDVTGGLEGMENLMDLGGQSGPVTWPLRLTDVVDDFPSLLEDVLVSSTNLYPGEGNASDDDNLNATDHYDTIIQSILLNLQGTPEAVEQSLDMLSRAFEKETEASKEVLPPPRRSALGSLQTKRYAANRSEDDSRDTLAQEADILEAMAFGDTWSPSNETDELPDDMDYQHDILMDQDQFANEASWREYWMAYHERYGCWPGGEIQMVQPDHGAYVRVPLSLLQRYFELETKNSKELSTS
jgi:superfamily II DNA/RNA helicase